MKFGIGLATSVFMSINTENASAGGTTKNSEINIGLISLEVKFENCTVEIIVNDIPVKRYTSDQNSFQSDLIGEYLIAGSNKFEIIINPGSTPSKYREKYKGEIEDNIFVATRVVQYKLGEAVDGSEGNTLVHALWRGNENKDTSFPHILSLTTSLPKIIPKWSWQKSEILELPRDQNAMMGILEEFHDAYQKLDGDKIFNLIKIVLEENNKAHLEEDVPSINGVRLDIITFS